MSGEVVDDIMLECRYDMRGCITRGKWVGEIEVKDMLGFMERLKEKMGRALVFNLVYGGKGKEGERYILYFYDTRQEYIDRVIGEVRFRVQEDRIYVVYAEWKKVEDCFGQNP